MRTYKENYNVVDINSRKKSETKQTTCGETPATGASDENVEQTAELSEQDILDLYAGEMKVETPDLWDRIVAGIDEAEHSKSKSETEGVLGHEDETVSLNESANIENQKVAYKPVKTPRFSGRRVSVAVTTIAALIIICVIVAPLMGDRSENRRRISDKAENNIDIVDESAGEAESAGEHEDGAMSDGAQAEEQQAEAAESATRADATTNGGMITDVDQSANGWRMECRLVFAECDDGNYRAEVKKIVRIIEASGASSATDDTTVPVEGDEITITIDEAQLDRIETVYGSMPTEGMEISCVIVPWGDGGFKILEL